MTFNPPLPDVLHEKPSLRAIREKFDSSSSWIALKILEKVYLRTRLSESQNHRCAYCGIKTELDGPDKRRPTIEHVLTQVRGGTDDYYLCVMACKRCNNKRGDKIIPEELKLLEDLGYTNGN